MDNRNIINPMLDLMDRPAFCVQDGIIIQVNAAARQRQITEDMQISALLGDDAAAYEDFAGGALSLSIKCCGLTYTASVNRFDNYDVFCLESDNCKTQLEALELAAQHLRIPLSTAMTVYEQIFSGKDLSAIPGAGQLNKSLYQLHRLVGNISDAVNYYSGNAGFTETVNFTALFSEIMEKSGVLLENLGLKLIYEGPEHAIFGLADREKLTRAIYNLLSNAAKFSPAGSTVCASLSRHGDMLHFTLQDYGSGIPREIIGNVFSRFLRQPGIEDGRSGIGLGIPLVYAAAAAHGGTLLIDSSPETGARITMTIRLKKADGTQLRSPVLTMGDYTGGCDMALLEFSDVLPAEKFEDI